MAKLSGSRARKARGSYPWGRPIDSKARIALHLASVSWEEESLERLHRAIEREIARSARAIERAQSRDQDFIETVIDEECPHIEQLLGLAFVAAQNFITTVRTRWADLIPVCKTNFPRFKSPIDPKNLLKQSPPLRTGSTYTTLEAINAVANYWKHCDEWPVIEKKIQSGGRVKGIDTWDLNSMNRNPKRTAEIALALGMSYGSTGNLRTAAEKLGVSDYGNLSPVRKILSDWAGSLYQKMQVEIRRAIQ